MALTIWWRVDVMTGFFVVSLILLRFPNTSGLCKKGVFLSLKEH